MNRILLLLLFCISQQLSAQYVYTIKADSVKITNNCDTAELIIENHTQDVPGFLFNKGKGRTEFRRAVKLNDSMLVIGEDTMLIKGTIAANNGLSVAERNVQLGQSVGDVGNPAALSNHREIPLNGFNATFSGTGNIGIGTNSPTGRLHIVGAVDTPQLVIVNAPGQTAPLFKVLSSDGTRLYEVRTYGDNNIFLGVDAGIKNTTGFYNIGIGKNTLNNNVSGSYNLAFGATALQSNTGSYNAAFGAEALKANTTGGANIAVGPLVLSNNTTGNYNVSIAGSRSNTTGNRNTSVGLHALYNVTTGSGNIAVGMAAGRVTNGDKNIFIGDSAGRFETGSYKLYISNTSTTTPLIYGEFDNNILKLNGRIFVGATNTPTAALHIVAGTNAAGTAPIKLTAGTILTTPEDGAIEFDGVDLYLTENSTRYKLSKILTGQLTTNFGGPSLSAYNSVTTTLSVPGAQPGDVVNVSANTGAVNPPSIIISAYVTSVNTVTIQAYNASNSAVSIASDTYKVRVIK